MTRNQDLTIEEALKTANAIVSGFRELMKPDRLFFLPPSGKDGESPLFHAVDRNDTGAVIQLLDAGADPNPREDTEEILCDTPLHRAIRPGKESLPIVVALLDAGANPHALNRDNETPLDLATRMSDEAVVIALVNAGAADPVDSESGDLLHWAVDRKHETVVIALLKTGVNPDVQDNLGCTPLYYAASSGNLPLVEALMDAGANPYLPNFDGISPVQEAYNEETVEAMKRET